MKTLKTSGLLLLTLIFISFTLIRCKKDEPMQGNLQVKAVGLNFQGIKDAIVHLTPADQTELSDNLGNVLFRDLDISQLYTINISKEGYDSFKQSGIQLKADQTLNLTVNLTSIPILSLSDSVFDFDSVKMQIPLFISNKGQGILTWQIMVGSLAWINAIPSNGETGSDPDIVYLTIDRTDLVPGIYNENIFINSNGGLISIEIKVIVSSPHQSTVTDIDGNVYPTIKIGDQWWMKENLIVTHNPSGSSIQSYYFNNSLDNLAIYGRLYSWEVSMNNIFQEKTQGICPNGWHIPSNDEWYSLIMNLGGFDVAGGELKSTGTSYWFTPNQGATNSSGFTGLPGGDRWYDGTYHFKGERAFFWTSTNYDYSQAFLTYLHNNNTEIVIKEVLKENAMSVRCIKD